MPQRANVVLEKEEEPQRHFSPRRSMAIHCKSLQYHTREPWSRVPNSSFFTTQCTSLPEAPFYINSNSLKLSKTRVSLSRLNKKISAVVSQEKEVEPSDSWSDDFKLTYLEGNSWLWEVGGANILVDPILVGNLDFGIPWLYDAAKRFLKSFTLDDLPAVDCLLITQSLDDHCHLKTLRPLSQKMPNIRVVATPNAKELLGPLFSNVTYLEPGEGTEIHASNGASVKIQATAGPVLGPPWQRPENGYLVNSPGNQLTLYYEPHCVYNENFLKKARADIVITPVIKQLLPNFTLVSGQEDAVRLAKLLQAKFVVPMKNGDLDSKGLLSRLVRTEGTIGAFRDILLKEVPNAQVLEPIPGVPLHIAAPAKVS